MKKRKHKLKNFLNEFKPIIDNHKNELPIFNLKNKNKKFNTETWFDINYSKQHDKQKCNIISTDDLDNIEYKCIQIKMILTDIHKQILQNWFNASTYTYNKTLEYIRNNFNFTKNEVTRNILETEINNNGNNFFNKRYIRTKMNIIRSNIQELFKFNIDKKYTLNKKNIICKIDAHTLDKTIFQLVQNIKSAKTNLLRRNIKRFRLKFWKYNRPKQVLELEKCKISEGILCKSIFENLPKIKYIYNSEEYDIKNVDTDFKISYNSILDEYLLLVPIKVLPDPEIETKTNKKDLIVLDPGLRTFMTGLSDNIMIKIGQNVNKKICKLLKKEKKIKYNKEIPNKIKKKNEKIINKKIYNLINELHWCTIKFLTRNFKTIFLGDMSAKSIVAKNNHFLSDEMKVACLRTRFYEFRQRLKYKGIFSKEKIPQCSLTNTKFKLVDEYYTSKTCSLCGSYKQDLGGNKIYNCINCNKSIDRDINGCRNIYLKQYILHQ